MEAAQYTLPNHANTQSNKVNCGICKKLGLNHGTPHQMNQSYLVCVSKSCQSKLYEQKCAAQYKLEICELSGQIYLYGLNTHNDSESKFELEDTRGLDKNYRKLIERLITKKEITTTKAIEIEPSKSKYVNKLKGAKVPDSVQIKNYLSYRRKRLGKLFSLNVKSHYFKIS